MADDELLAAFAATVDEVLGGAYDGSRRAALLRRGGWDARFAAELAELGWFSLAVPESLGGAGAPLSALGPVLRRVGEHLVIGPMLEDFLLPALLGGLEGAWEAAPAIAAAVESGVPLAVVDPGMSDDWAADVGAVRDVDGRLHGTVEPVRFATQSGLLVVLGESRSGPALWLVDPTADGVVVTPLRSDDPAATFARVAFVDVVPEGGGPVGSGADHGLVERLRSWVRLLVACELAGIARRCLELTVDHVRHREQFGRPIGSFQAVKHIAADMRVRTTGLENLCSSALADADGADDRGLFLLGATAKAHAGVAAIRVCEDAIQLHGGIGFTAEHVLTSYYKRALVLRAWYGDPEELEARIGAAVLAASALPDAPEHEW